MNPNSYIIMEYTNIYTFISLENESKFMYTM